MDKEEIKTFSIITPGECGVWKTSIINRFVQDKFEDYKSNNGVIINIRKCSLIKK